MSEVDGRGLQAERTILAWWRTALTAIVAGLLVVRQAFERSAHVAFAVAGGVALAVVLAVAVRRVLVLQRSPDAPPPEGHRTMAVLVLGTLTLQALALVLVA